MSLIALAIAGIAATSAAPTSAHATTPDHLLRIADIHLDVLEGPRKGDIVHIDLARSAYNAVLDANSTATPRQLAAAHRGLQELDAAVSGAQGTLESVFPPLRILWHQEQLLVSGNAESAAMKAAVSGLLTSRAGTVLASTPGQHIVLGVSEAGNVGVERSLRSTLQSVTDHLVLDDRDLFEVIDAQDIASIRHGTMPAHALRELIAALSTQTSSPPGVAVIMAKESLADGPLHAGQASLQVWTPSAEGGITSKLWTSDGLAMSMPPGGWWGFLLAASAGWPAGVLCYWICRRLDRALARDEPLVWWIAPAVAGVGLATAAITSAGLDSMDANLSIPMLSTKGITWIGLSLASVTLLPFAVPYLALAKLKVARSRLGDADTIALVLGAATLGGGGWAIRAIWQSEGAQAAMVALGCLVSVTVAAAVAIGMHLGRSSGKTTLLSRVRAAITIGVWVSFLVVLLTGDPRLVVVGAAGAVAIMLADLTILRWVARRRSGVAEPKVEDLAGTATEASVSAMLTSPPMIVTDATRAAIDTAVTHLVGPDSRVPQIEVVLIEADRGAGKTRLARSIADQCRRTLAAEDPDHPCEVLFGDCDDPAGGGSDISFEPFAQALAEYVDASQFKDPRSLAKGLQKGLATVGSTIAPLATGGLGSFMAGAPSEEDDHEMSRQEVAETVGKVLTRITGDGTRVVFILDDMHWAEESGVMGVLPDVIQTIAEDARDSGENDVCFIFATRGQSSASGAVFRSWLDELNTDGTIRLHDTAMADLSSAGWPQIREALLSGEQWLNMLPTDAARIRRVLDARDLVTPLDVLALLKAALAKGMLQPGQRRVRLAASADLDALPVDSGYDGLVRADLQELNPELLDILQCCAVVGRTFRPSVVADVFRVDLIALLQQLRAAEDKQLISDNRHRDDHYEFTDKRVVRVLRSMCSEDPNELKQSSELARAYHKRLVEHLVASYGISTEIPDHVPDHDLIAIADHAWAVHDANATDAFRYAAMIGARLTSLCLFRPARRVLTRAVEFARHHPETVSVQDAAQLGLDLVKCLTASGEDDALRASTAEWVQALASKHPENEATRRIEIDIELLDAERRSRSADPRDRDLARARLREMLGRNDLTPAQRLRGMFYDAFAMPRQPAGDQIEAYERTAAAMDAALEETEELAQRRDILTIQSELLNAMGLALVGSGAPDRAKPVLTASLALNREPWLSDKKGQGIALGALGDCEKQLGNVDEAIRLWRRNLVLSRTMHDLSGVCRMASQIAAALLDQVPRSEAAITEARSLYVESAEAARRLENAGSQLCALAGRVRVEHMQLSTDPEAIQELTDAIAVITSFVTGPPSTVGSIPPWAAGIARKTLSEVLDARPDPCGGDLDQLGRALTELCEPQPETVSS
ncbi:MAG: ATP-binding protein [Phycisphaerales bacterium]|nr:ATP-binding protein [Phycisphaerales bacterium]